MHFLFALCKMEQPKMHHYLEYGMGVLKMLLSLVVINNTTNVIHMVLAQPGANCGEDNDVGEGPIGMPSVHSGQLVLRCCTKLSTIMCSTFHQSDVLLVHAP